MIRVFHAVGMRYWDTGTNVDFPANYVHVADVKTNDLDKAFELTNSVDRVWWQNKGVKPDWAGAREWALRDADIVEKEYRQPSTAAAIRRRAGKGFRSTSVGDVLQKGDAYYVVAPFGFDPLPSGTASQERARRGSGLGRSTLGKTFETDVVPSGDTDIRGATILTYKGQLTSKIARAMDVWRHTMGPFPEAYVKYHEKMARKTLKQLQRRLGFKIHDTWMAPAGWFDGMRLLHAVIRTRKGNRLIEIAWYDSHGDGQWMVVDHGQTLASESELAGVGWGPERGQRFPDARLLIEINIDDPRLVTAVERLAYEYYPDADVRVNAYEGGNTIKVWTLGSRDLPQDVLNEIYSTIKHEVVRPAYREGA